MRDVASEAWLLARILLRFVAVRIARGKVRRHGGQLWIWTTPLGGANELIRTSFSRPDGLEFEHLYHDDLILWFERSVPIDKVTVGWTPMTGINVTWAGTPSAPGG